MASSTSGKSKAFKALPAWAGKTGWDSDVVLSTRARLARNVAGFAFPGRADDKSLQQIARDILRACRHPEKGAIGLRAVDIGKLSKTELVALVDSHLISVQHATAGPFRWALVDDNQTVSVMVHEEDHLRIQAILPGLQLMAAWRIADHLDDALGAHITYATDVKYGYLTASLANCGTGLRLSVMAHLPALTLSGKLPEAFAAARTLGVSVRGFYGEDSVAAGDVYQISNVVTIGLTESQIIARLAAVTVYLVTEEQSARELLWRTEHLDLVAKITDAAMRLAVANRLSAADAMSILSLLRLGDQYAIPTGVTTRVFNELLASMQMGVHLLIGDKTHYAFYEETRRPAFDSE